MLAWSSSGLGGRCGRLSSILEVRLEDGRRSLGCRDEEEEDEDDALDSWTYFRGGRLGGGVSLEEEAVSSCALGGSDFGDS